MRIRSFLLFLCAATVVFAGPPAATHDFIMPDAVDFHQLLSAPPDPASIAARGEQDLMRNLQIARTAGQAALAKYFEKLSVMKILAHVLGEWCTTENLPKTAALFEKVRRESRPIIEAAKSNWNRNRPYISDTTLQPVVERPANTSYPSGHSYESAVDAVLLSHLLPEHEEDWWKQAALVRWSRVIGGAHYPSDTVAGKILGEAVGKKLLESPALLKALEEAKAEIEAQTAAHAKKAA